MPRAVLEYLLHLYATIILPTTLWIIATAHIFYMLRSNKQRIEHTSASAKAVSTRKQATAALRESRCALARASIFLPRFLARSKLPRKGTRKPLLHCN